MKITMIVHWETSPRFDIACEVELLPHAPTSHQATSLVALESLSGAQSIVVPNTPAIFNTGFSLALNDINAHVKAAGASASVEAADV